MEKTIILGIAIIALAGVNVAALYSCGFFGLFVTAASVPLAQEMLKIIKNMENKIGRSKRGK